MSERDEIIATLARVWGVSVAEAEATVVLALREPNDDGTGAETMTHNAEIDARCKVCGQSLDTFPCPVSWDSEHRPRDVMRPPLRRSD